MNHAAIFFRDRKFELGESIDEERNQESCQEESRSEEEEVVPAANTSSEKAPGTGPFLFVYELLYGAIHCVGDEDLALRADGYEVGFAELAESLA